MPIYTREQLKGGVNATTNLTPGTYAFLLKNNTGNMYFAIESKNNTFVFNSANINTPINCSFVTGSRNAAFSVGAHSTASFNLVVTDEIIKENILYRATNIHIFDINDKTASGSFLGANMSY